MTQQFRIQRVSVNAICQGDFVILIDCHGQRLSSRKRRSDIECELGASIAGQWAWRLAVRRMKDRFTGRCTLRQKTPWQAKADNLASSFRIRARFFHSNKARSRQRFERYSTSTWEAASKRLWEQGHNRFRRHRRGGWVRWAHTVANNHNKKQGGRYANARYRDRQDDHGTN